MNDDKEKAASQENAGNLQPCCDRGRCCPSGSEGGGKNWKIAVFILIVVAAGVVLARSLISKSNSAADQRQQLFATVPPDGKPDTPAAVNITETQEPNQPASSLWGEPLDSLASLNKVAAGTNAVFILLAADDQASSDAATKQIEAAAKTIRGGGTRISAFRLKPGTADYANLTKQLSVPCVLAMVRGGGMSGVLADQITETKLVQAFVAASRPSSGCCPPGSGVTCP
jgi:hypothetical protein